MRCPACNHEVPAAPFCELCGQPLKAEEAGPVDQTSGAAPPAKAAGPAQAAAGYPRWHRIVWAVMAIVLSAVIADAAVETFLGDSPLRWWIACAAGLYFVVCAAAWFLMPRFGRHMNWETQAAVALVLLLALLGATVWLPGGLDQGLSALGQTTATILDVVSALVVALAGVSLARQPFIPLQVKALAGLLAVYSVAAFAWAVHSGTPYASLFHGASLWTRLPFWLQGATLGALLLVPVALLLEVITGLQRTARPARTEIAFKATALALGLAITFAAVRLPVDDVSAATVAPNDTASVGAPDNSPTPATGMPETPGESSGKPPQEAAYTKVGKRLSRFMAGVDVIDSKIDHSLFEIDALADRLGSDPNVMFHFVRDAIRYEPYSGVLRGALGTLLCRAGNSLDRSLLLSALLQKAGLHTQIAQGQLSPQQALILVNRVLEPVKPVPQILPSLAELIPEIGRAMGVDPAKLMQAADEAQKAADKQQQGLESRAEGETNLISALLGKAGVDAGVITSGDQLLAEAGEHYWVQYQDSNGQWVDLDSAFADAEPGKSVVPAANTFAPDSVPEETYHHIHITMTIRVAQLADGKDGPATDTTLLDQELRVADQQDVDIILANQAVPMQDLTKPGANLPQAIASIKGFQTVLQIGDRSITGKYFDLAGRVSDKLGGPVGDVVTNAGGLGGALGGLGGGIGNASGGGAPQGAAGRIVGEWVDYALISPRPKGQSPAVRNYHRDIVAPVKVNSWSPGAPPETASNKLPEDALRRRLMWYSELYPVSGSMIPGYAGYLQVQSLRAAAANLDSMLKSIYGLLPDQPVTMPPRRPIASTLLASESMYVANKLDGGRFPDLRSYFGNAGLISYETGGMGAAGAGSAFTQGYDIVAYAPRVVAARAAGASSTARPQAALLHITQGALATRLEWELMAGSLTAPSGDPHVVNASKVFGVAQQLGVPILVLRPGAGSGQQIATISAADPVKAELAADLSAQQVLVVPSRAVDVDGQPQTAWWRLDPSSGELIGVGPGGRGQAMEEYIKAAENVNLVICILGAGKDVAKDNLTKGALGGLMCVMSRVVGANGTPEEPMMSILGIMIHVVLIIGDIAEPEEPEGG